MQSTLANLRREVEAKTAELGKTNQTAAQAKLAQDARMHSLEKQTKQREAECQETLANLRRDVEAKTAELEKANKTAAQAQLAQDARMIQRSDETTQENSLREESKALYEPAATSGKTPLIKSFIDQKDQAQAWSQCKQAQLAQEAKLQRLEAQSEETQAVIADTLGSDCITYIRPPSPTTEETKRPQPTTPHHTFLYSCSMSQLHRVNLLTGEQSSHEVPHYQFKGACRWSELPGGSLLITGGKVDSTSVRDVVRVDVGTFAVSPQPPMHTARYGHAAVYHSQYVYVLGFSKCERYSCAESRWEVLPALPLACYHMSGVEVENSVYALGGYSYRGEYLDSIQKLSLDSLTWELMQLKLPQVALSFPCFKRETQVYLVIEKTLYSFTPLEVKAVKTLDTHIFCNSSYYSRGTLYYEEVGSISSLALKLG
jgi:hypothetical protein